MAEEKKKGGGFMKDFIGTLSRKKGASELLASSPTYGSLRGLFQKSSKSNISSPNNVVKNASLGADMQWKGKLEDIIKIESKLAEGMYGPCYKATLISYGIPVVAKRIFPDKDQLGIRSVTAEVEALKKLSHENIVSYWGLFPLVLSSRNVADTSLEMWLLTGYEAGGSVFDLIGRFDSLAEECIGLIVSGTLKGLKHLNAKGYVHRNLRSSNILLSSEGIPKLCDFGLAKSLAECASTKKTVTMKEKSTIYWQAPELHDQSPISENVDIWALGMTMHEMCDKQTPLSHLAPLKVYVALASGRWSKSLKNPKDWSPELNSFVEECLQEERTHRKTPVQIFDHPFVQKYKSLDPSEVLKPLLDSKYDPRKIFMKTYGNLKVEGVDTTQFWESEEDTPSNILRLSMNEIELCKGASIKKLVEVATQNPESPLPAYIAFSYQTITTGDELLSLLAKRYRGTSTQQPADSVLNSVALILSTWITYNSAELICTPLGKKVLSFVTTLPGLSNRMDQKVLNRIELLQDPPLRQQNIKDFIHSIQKPDDSPKNPPSLYEISALDLAHALTLIEWKVMRNIQPQEFQKQAWNKKEAERKAPWLLFYVEFFNQRSRWFSTALLKEENVKERVLLLEKFIEMGQHLLDLKNYNGALELSASLFSAPISRLKQTWAKISSSHKQTLQRIEDFLNPAKNYQTYREALKSTDPPCLPYIGLMLTDMTFIDDANPDRLDNDLINVEKVNLLGANLKRFYQLTEKEYSNLVQNPEARDLLLSREPWVDQDFFNISKMREDNSIPVKESTALFSSKSTPMGKEDIDVSEEFTNQDVNLLLGAANHVEFEDNEVILGDTQPPLGLFRIARGQVNVERRDTHGDYRQVDLLSPEEWFGESSMLNPEIVSYYSYTAVGAVEVDYISVDLLNQVLASNPWLATRLYKKVAGTMAVRLRDWSAHTGSGTLRDATAREKSPEQSQLVLKKSQEIIQQSQKDLSQPKVKNDDLFKRLFGISEVVLRKIPAVMDHAKGHLFLTRNSIGFHGTVFGFTFKRLRPIESLKLTVHRKTTVTTVHLDRANHDFHFKTAQEANEINLLIVSLMKNRDSDVKDRMRSGSNAQGGSFLMASTDSRSSASSTNSNNNSINSSSSSSKARLGTVTPSLSILPTGSMTFEDWKLILQGNKPKKYKEGEIILMQDSPPKQRIFQVFSGSCQVVKEVNNTKIPVAEIKEGEVFGEISFLTRGNSAASVVAMADCEIYKLQGYFLNIVFERNEGLGARFYKYLASTLMGRIEMKEEVMRDFQEKAMQETHGKRLIKRSTRSLLNAPPPKSQ